MKKILLLLLIGFIAFINSNGSISTVISSSEHSVVVDISGCVWTFGQGRSGQLGHKVSENKARPTQIAGLNQNIVAVSTGFIHTVLLDNQGGVWTFGNGESGQTGRGNTERNIPKKIEELKNIKAISAGYYHTILLDEEGFVWSFGGGQRGQLGHGDYENKNTPTKIDDFHQNVIAISAGNYHTVLLDAQGEVWTFGAGAYGRLGHGDTENKLTPTKINGLNQNIIAIAAGGEHTILLDSEGEVWAFGCGKCGQLGNGEYSNQTTPTKIVHFNQKILGISAATYQTVVLDSEGTVWSFGGGYSGQLGHGDYDNKIIPTKIISLPQNIVGVFAGTFHTMVLDAEGGIWNFGCGAYGQLGHGDNKDRLIPTKIENIPPVALPVKKGRQIKNAASAL